MNNNICVIWMLNTLAKNMITKLMVMENFILTMEIFWKENLKTADVKVKEDGSSQMEVIMKVILEITLLMVMESISISTDINTKDNGKIIYPTVKDKHNTQMEADTMVNFSITKDMVKVF